LQRSSDGNWKYLKPFQGAAESDPEFNPPAPGKAPTSTNTLLSSLTGFRAEGDKGEDFVADRVPEADLKNYHLGPADEVLRVSVKRSGDAKPVTVLVGVGKKFEEKKGEEKVEKYNACVEGENNIVRVPVESVEVARELLKKPDAMRDRHLVRAVSFKTPD